MPVLAKFDGILIEMYYNDHNPPHFHAYYGDEEIMISIAKLDIMAGRLPPAVLRKVLAWARERQEMLALEWIYARSHLPLGRQ